MKILLPLALCALGATSTFAQVNDSVYIRGFADNPKEGFHIQYSSDQKTWVTIGDNYNFFKSDYGPWGSEKKMYTPTLRYDGKKFYAEFIPNPIHNQIGVTESTDLWLWKPQDYPVVTDTVAFNQKKQMMSEHTGKDVIRVPWSIVKNLITNVEAAKYRAEKEKVSLAQDSANWSAKASLKVNLKDTKSISPSLFGIFFEDINYSADGGLYAELIQNRDFEYTAHDHKKWTSTTSWKLEGEGTTMKVNTENPISANNLHYVTLTTTQPGARFVNQGWDSICVKEKEKYDLSLFLRGTGKVRVSIVSKGKTHATATFTCTPEWKQQKTVLTANATTEKGVLWIEPLEAGKVDVDFVSLFPEDTYMGRKNGLRKDLAEKLADLHPQFVRFPGGCMSHGQGINNIYHWQSSIGELWDRQPDPNIWNYHQTRGLGFYEYFQFCEDIGAQPLPVLSAGVPCQNSWRGGNGQQGGIPFEKQLNGKPSPYTYNGKPLTMESYLQELLDLIEWANGDAKTSPLAALRAKAGHPKPFGLKYLGIGNEDLLGDTFNERFDFLYKAISKAHPEITIVGTVGPFWEGSDYECGWQHARELGVPIVDEHYYNNVGWYLNNENFYDRYPRTGTKVYLGEWASKGNRLENALAEALHITQLERNGDVVEMSSYAPLLAKWGHTNWNPDMIFFNNTDIFLTPNYYVQRMCGQNAGDSYVYAQKSVKPQNLDNRVASSVVTDKETGDIIIKLVNLLPSETPMSISLGDISGYSTTADVTTLSGDYHAREVAPVASTMNISSDFSIDLPTYSFTVIRISKSKNAKKSHK